LRDDQSISVGEKYAQNRAIQAGFVDVFLHFFKGLYAKDLLLEGTAECASVIRATDSHLENQTIRLAGWSIDAAFVFHRNSSLNAWKVYMKYEVLPTVIKRIKQRSRWLVFTAR